MLIKTLTVRQPFAAAIMLGRKRIEYRSWATRYRGALLIHASSKAPEDEALRRYPIPLKDRPIGVIVGTVDMVDCAGSPGNFEWILRNPRPFRWPIPHKGQVGLWTANLTCNCEHCQALQDCDLRETSMVCVRCGKHFNVDLFTA